MSEEKLYLVKNNKGEYLAGDSVFDSDITKASVYSLSKASEVARDERDFGGHVVAFVEESKKVVVSPEEAKLVKNCLWTNSQESFLNNINLLFRGRRPEDVTRLKGALTDGYTVAKEKKYNVKVPHTKEAWYYKSGDTDLLTIRPADKELCGKFTESEIEHYGLQDCEKEEVADDGND